jgi:hypothetical protein
MRVRQTKLLLFVVVAIVAGCSSSRRIDGTSSATFERSVALLQNDLPARRRDDFDNALAVTWMRAAALDASDVDGDGDTDYFDARALADNVSNLLAAIRRGDFVNEIENSKAAAVAAAYFEQLDGLGYDELVGLVGDSGVGPYVAGLKRQISGAGCNESKGRPPPLGYTSRIRTCD